MCRLSRLSWPGLTKLALAATFLATPIFAQERTPEPHSKDSSLHQLIQEALDRNPMLKAAKYEAVAKEAEIAPSGAWEDPLLMIEAMNYPVDTFNPREMGMTGTQVTYSQKVPFPGKLSKLRRSTTHDYHSKRAQFEDQQLQTIKEVKVGYYELYLAHKRRELLRERKGILDQLIVVTRNKYTLGKVAQAELLNMQLEAANLLSELLVADKEIITREAALRSVLARGEDKPLGRPAALHKTKVDFSRLTEAVLADRVLGKNRGLDAAKMNLNAAEAKLSYARWNYLPDLEFKVGYTFRQPNMDDRGVDTLSAGIGLMLPIWPFTRQAPEARMASAERTRMEAMLDQQRNELLSRIRSGYAEMKTGQERLQVFESALLPLARQSVVTGRSSYLTGKLEYVSLLNLINARFQTELDYQEALVNYETRIAEFEALMGEPIGVANE